MYIYIYIYIYVYAYIHLFLNKYFQKYLHTNTYIVLGRRNAADGPALQHTFLGGSASLALLRCALKGFILLQSLTQSQAKQ